MLLNVLPSQTRYLQFMNNKFFLHLTESTLIFFQIFGELRTQLPVLKLVVYYYLRDIYT